MSRQYPQAENRYYTVKEIAAIKWIRKITKQVMKQNKQEFEEIYKHQILYGYAECAIIDGKIKLLK